MPHLTPRPRSPTIAHSPIVAEAERAKRSRLREGGERDVLTGPRHGEAVYSSSLHKTMQDVVDFLRATVEVVSRD